MPLLWISLAFIAGILCGKLLPQAVFTWGIAALCFSVWFIGDRVKKPRWWKKITPLPPALILVFFALGGLRITLAQPVLNESSLAWYNDQGKIKLTGWVNEPPDVRESGVYMRMTITELEKVNAESGMTTNLRISGDCLVKFPAGVDYQLGDQLQFAAEPRTPSSSADFSYRDYLSRQGIYSVIYIPQSVKRVGTHPVNLLQVWLEALRQRARRTIFTLFPQPESGLLSGILLGLDNDLPASLLQAYRDTGTSHIIAISGFNMAVLAGLLMTLSSKAFNPYVAFLLTAVGLCLYSALVGGSASVLRAAVMSIVAMGGHLIGRSSTGENALCFTAALMCVFNPLFLWDTSFQLSFSATLGLVLFGPPLQAWVEGLISRRVPEEQIQRYSAPISEYFLLTLAAQIATLPVIVLQFKRLSISSLLSNPLVLPAQPAVLIVGGLTTLAGMAFEPLGKIGAFIAWPLLAYTNRVVSWLAHLAGESLAVDSRLAVEIAVLCLAGFFIFLFRNSLKKLLGKISFAWISLGLLAVVIAVWAELLHRPDGKLHLEMIRSGEEINLVVTAPAGEKLVSNPQGSIDELTSAVSQTLSPWQHSVDAVLLTQRKAAKSISSFDERLSIKQVILAPPLTHLLEDVSPLQIDAHIPSAEIENADTLAIGSAVNMQIIAADQNTAALLLDYKKLRVLIPGGIDPALILKNSPQALNGLTALVLTPNDLVFVPPGWWEQFKADIILWQDISLPPNVGWVSLQNSSALELVSDGSAYSILAQ